MVLMALLTKNIGADSRILMVIDYYVLKVLLTPLLSCLSILRMLSRVLFFIFLF